MTKEKCYGPGLIGFILLTSDDESEIPHFKEPIKWTDCRDNDHWVCGECKETMPEHTSVCPVHLAFQKYEEEQKAYVRPEWMCSGCDQPKEGPHRFGCCVRGIRSTQVILPVTQNSNGNFSVDKTDIKNTTC